MLENVPHEAEDFLKWILGFLILLFVIWVIKGGPSKVKNPDDPFIRPPAPLDTGETYSPQAGATTSNPTNQ